MDMPAPVATQITSPPPGASLNTMLGFLDVAKSRQALQLGQQQVAQAQMETGRQKAVQSFFKSWDPSKYISPDGTTDVDKAMGAPEFQQADGLAKPGIAEALQGIKSRQMGVKGQLQTLDDDSIQSMARGLQGIQQDEDVLKGTQAGKDKVHQFYDTFAQRSPQAQRISNIYRQVVDGAPQGKLSEAVGAQAAMAQDVSATRPQFGTLADGRTAVRDPIRQTIWLPQERRMANPGEVAAFKPVAGGGANSINVTTPQVAAQTAAATGGVGIDVDRANTVSSAANSAPGAIRLSQKIDSLADQISSGKIAKGLSAAAAAVGADPISYSRQLLNKDLGQLKTVASYSASTDAKMGTILSGYPDDTSATPTIHTAMDYIRGTFRQSLARGKNLESYSAKHKDLSGFQHADNVLAQSTDPLMHEYLSLSPAERSGFYTRNFRTAEEAQAFKNKVKGVFHVTGQ